MIAATLNEASVSSNGLLLVDDGVYSLSAGKKKNHQPHHRGHNSSTSSLLLHVMDDDERKDNDLPRSTSSLSDTSADDTEAVTLSRRLRRMKRRLLLEAVNAPSGVAGA